MRITATIENSPGSHKAVVETEGKQQELQIPAKASGSGSAVNGGELLFLALATCFCNDIYREAARQQLNITRVWVEVKGSFGGVGEPASGLVYRAKLQGDASDEALAALLQHTDRVAEIQNTLRAGVPVTLIP